jgi:hypothetical protein
MESQFHPESESCVLPQISSPISHPNEENINRERGKQN